jgi:hypothetical protein
VVVGTGAGPTGSDEQCSRQVETAPMARAVSMAVRIECILQVVWLLA